MPAEIMMDMEDAFRQQQVSSLNEKMDTDEDDTIKKPHPLLIEHVMENIARHLIQERNDDTLLQSRLVCEVWDRVSTKILRFHSNRAVYFGKYFRRPEALSEFTNYLKLSSSFDNFPIGKFYLCEDVFQNNHIDSVQTFFNNCSNLITSLTIRLDHRSDLNANDIDFKSFTLTYLKSLTVDDRRIIQANNENNIATIAENLNTNAKGPRTILEGLIKSSPNLQKLTIVHPAASLFDDDETVMNRRRISEQDISQMLVNNCPKHLKNLNLDIYLNDKVLLTLSQLPHNSLLEFQLSLRESVFTRESLNTLLECQKESLRSLKFFSMSTKSHFEIAFPVFPNLTHLELHSWDCQIQGVTMSKISYEKNFPSLNSLVLHTWAENPGWTQFFPAAYYGSIQTITSLKLPQNFMYPAMIQNLSWLYPNLTKLDVHFSKTTSSIIQRIFSHFSSQLEELKIRDSLPREKCDICLDPLFSGLPFSVCEKILKRKLFNPDPKVNHLLRLRQYPSLLNLKNLRKLDIEDVLRHETYVTDVTGYLILLQMPNLRILIMGRSQIDDECLGQLAKKYPTNMEKALESPKPTQHGMKNNNFLMIGSSNLHGYNYCLSTFDLANACVIC